MPDTPITDEEARIRAWAMERAQQVIALHTSGNPDGTVWWTTGKFAETVKGLSADFAVALAAARREALEEAAQAALTYRDEADAGKYPGVGDPDRALGQGYAANRIAKRIRALASQEPKT